MHFGNIKYCDIANGEGVRTTLFVSGCTHRCPGCFQPETWDFFYGKPFVDATADKIVDSLKPGYIAGLTVLGGEPMEPENQKVLAPFLARIKREFPAKTIWAYTGDTLEDVLDHTSSRHTEYSEALLASIDVLVDGPFIEAYKDITLRFRGSSNQRIIDMPATLSSGIVTTWHDDPLFATHRME